MNALEKFDQAISTMKNTWYELGIINPDGSTQTIDVVDDRTMAMERFLKATTGGNPPERIDFVDEWENDKNGYPTKVQDFDMKYWLLDTFLMNNHVFSDDDRDNIMHATHSFEWVSEEE